MDAFELRYPIQRLPWSAKSVRAKVLSDTSCNHQCTASLRAFGLKLTGL